MKKSLLFLFILGILNLIYSSSTSATGLANSPWPAYNGGGKLQGRNQYSGTNVYRTIKWVYIAGPKANGDFYGSATIGIDGTIYKGSVSTTSPLVYAFNPENGSVEWTYAVGSSMLGSVAVSDDGTLYFGADNFYALNSNGTLKWSYTGGNYQEVHPNIDSDGTIYTDVTVSPGVNRIRAFNQDGSVKWTSADSVTGGFNRGMHPPALDENYAYMAGNNKLIAINKNDGSTAWTNTNIRPYSGHVSVGDDGRLYIAYTNNAWALENTGSEVWHNTEVTGANNQGWSSLDTNGNLVRGILDVPRKIYTFNKNDGVILKTYDLEGGIYANSVIIDRNNNLYFGEINTGKAKVVDSGSNLKWEYAVTQNAFAVNTSDSEQFEATFAVDDDGDMYLGNYNYKLYAWKLWTVNGDTNAAYYHPGDIVAIAATSSMLKQDPTTSEDNQVQAIMPNGDKVVLTYVSSANGETTWQGTYTIPTDTADGTFTATVEAGAVNVQTDITTHFATAPTGSSNTGITNTFTYIVDNTAPTSGTVSINSGNTITSSLDVNLTLSATDLTTSVTHVMISNISSFYEGSWEAYATTKSWTLSTGDGTKTVYVKYKDSAGNISTTYTDTIVLDTTVPAGTISINSAVTYTTTQAVTLTITATDNLTDVMQMKISESDVFTGASWETYSTTKTWTLSSGDGTKTVYIKFKDGAGNESIAYSDTITLDTIPPTDEVSINSGATYTNTPSVTVTIKATDAISTVSQMMLSESNVFTGASWETYSTTKSWTLSSGDGTKTVYVKFKDGAGNESTSYSDSIILDTVKPIGTITIEGGLKYINKHEVRLTLTLIDTNSTSSLMMVSENSTFASASWETFSNTKTFTLSNNDGSKTVYLKLKDAAGNESLIYSSAITIDTTLPILVPVKLNTLTFKPNVYSFYYTTGKNLTISGTTEPLATVTITVFSDPKTCITTADAQGNFNCVFRDQILTGDHTIKLTSTDLAGNITTYHDLTLGINTGLAQTGSPAIVTIFLGLLSLGLSVVFRKRFV